MTIQNREDNSIKIKRLQFSFVMDNWRKYMRSKLSNHISSSVLEVGARSVVLLTLFIMIILKAGPVLNRMLNFLSSLK